MIKVRRLTLLVLVLALVPLAGCSKRARLHRALAAADRDFQAGRFDEAEFEYQRARQFEAMDPVAIRQLGLVYYNQGKTLAALNYLRKAVELTPENVEARLKLALICSQAHRMPEARGHALWVLGLQPTNETALLLMVETVTNAQQLVECQQTIKNLQAQNPDVAAFHLALGWVAIRQQNITNAEPEIDLALKMDPNSGSAHLAKGTLLWARHQLPEADEQMKLAAQLSPVRSGVFLRTAAFQLETGAVTNALNTVRDALKQAPDYMPGWKFIAETDYSRRQWDDCDAAIEKVLAIDPRDYDAMLLKGKVLLGRGDVKQAVASFDHMSTVMGPIPQVLFNLAVAQALNSDVGAAVTSLNQALARDPTYAEAILLRAELNIRRGEAVPAISSLTELVARQPKLVPAMVLLASAYVAVNKTDDALAVYQKMAEAYPKSPQPPFLSGLLLVRMRQWAPAREAFLKSLELQADYGPALEQIVDLDIREKKYDAALARLDKEIADNPDVGQLYLLRASVREAQKNLDVAEADALKAIEVDPNLQSGYLFLAQIYIDGNKQKLALDRLNSLVARTNDYRAYMKIATIHDSLKEYPAAREAYEKATQLNPRFTAALNNLAYLYAERLDQLDLGYETAQRARDLDPYNPATADTLGWILYQKGDFARALGMLQESAVKLGHLPEVQFHLGMANYMAGNEDAARTALNLAVQSADQFPGKQDAAQRLQFLAIDPKTVDAARLADLEKTRTANPKDPVLLSRLAAVYERDGATDKAKAAFEGVLEVNPKNALAMAHLAQLYSGPLKDPEKALELAKSAHGLAGDDPAVSYVLARLVLRSGKDYGWALSLFQEAGRDMSDDPVFQHDLAWAYYDAGQPAAAVSAMQKALQSGLGSPAADDARRFLALVAITTNPGQAGAADQVRDALAADPESVPAQMASAALMEQKADYQGAQQIYESIFSHDSLFVPAARRLAILYAGVLASHDPKAYDVAKDAREAFPDDPEVSKAAGILAYRCGEPLRAVDWLSDAAATRGNDGEIQYYLGMAQYNLKRNRQSKETLQRALSLDLPTHLADEAKRVLASLK